MLRIGLQYPPSVCIGDLVRFRFEVSIEVIGEVGEVQVKTETYMLFLYIPLGKHASYALALMNSKNKDEVVVNMSRCVRIMELCTAFTGLQVRMEKMNPFYCK